MTDIVGKTLRILIGSRKNALEPPLEFLDNRCRGIDLGTPVGKELLICNQMRIDKDPGDSIATSKGQSRRDRSNPNHFTSRIRAHSGDVAIEESCTLQSSEK